MKKIITSLFLVLLLTVTAQAESKLQTILKNKELRVGTTGDWDPMSVKDPATNSYKGFDIDVMNELAKDMGVKVKFVPTDWKTIVSGITADRYDISTSVTKTDKRAEVAGFTETYYKYGTVPLVLKKNLKKFSTWDSLNNKDVTIATTLGTSQEEKAKEFFPKSKLKSVEAPARDFQEVLAGRADGQLTKNITVFIRTSPFDKYRKYYSNSASIDLPIATNNSLELVKNAIEGLKTIYKYGYFYQKAGVILNNLVEAKDEEFNLLTPLLETKSKSLMKAIDSTNIKYGRNSISIAQAGFKKSWKMRREHYSFIDTASFDSLPVLKL